MREYFCSHTKVGLVILDDIEVLRIRYNPEKDRYTALLQQSRIEIFPHKFNERYYHRRSKRQTWVKIPPNQSTETIREKLKKHSEHCIYRIMSHRLDDVMGSFEKDLLAKNKITLHFLKKKYFVEYKFVDKDKFSSEKPVYSTDVFSRTFTEDLLYPLDNPSLINNEDESNLPF